MRILHINCNFTGSELHQNLINHLAERKINNTVVIPLNIENSANYNFNDDIHVLKSFSKKDRFVFHYKQKKIINSIDNSVNINNYDLLHAHTLFTDGYGAMILSKKYKKPYVVAIRNTDLNIFMKFMPWLRSTGLEIMENASRIFFLSESYKDTMISEYVPEKMISILNDKCSIIPNGIDDFWINNIYDKKKIKKDFDDIINILYVGKINKNKNILTTQKAVNILRKSGLRVRYTIIGPIEDNGVYKRINFDNDTIYIEKKNKEELLDYYRLNDIFVMPSFKETFGLVYAEAMSQGLPVIYSSRQGFDGQFDEGLVGYAVESNSDKDIATKIIKIINNYDEINKNVINMVNKFSWGNIVDIYFKEYQNICY